MDTVAASIAIMTAPATDSSLTLTTAAPGRACRPQCRAKRQPMVPPTLMQLVRLQTLFLPPPFPFSDTPPLDSVLYVC